jgi:hypothetical protein
VIGRAGLSTSPAVLWAATWALWLATGALAPVPPWRAAAVLEEELEITRSLSARPADTPLWSIDVGGTWQVGALSGAWSPAESFVEHGLRSTFAWIDGASAEVTFSTSGWADAHLAVRAYPLEALAPLTVTVELDGASVGDLSFAAGWNIARLPIGAVTAGRHTLTLLPAARARPPGEARTLSLAVDGVAVGPTAMIAPTGDRGVFPGWLRLGPHERPAVFVSAGAAPAAVDGGTLRPAARRGVAPHLDVLHAFAAPAPTIPGIACELLNGIAAAALVLLVPGLCWTGLLRLEGGARLVGALAASAVILVAAFVTLRLAGREPAPLALALVLAVLGAVPLPFLRGRGAVAASWLTVAPTAIAVVVLTAFAVGVVPPLEDQDMEVQGTAHGLATRLEPRMVTNRGTTWFFAHPPLVHFWTAGTLTLSGRLPRLAVYHEAARSAAPDTSLPASDAPLDARPYRNESMALLRRFLEESHLWPTRQANVLAAALAIGVVTGLAASLAWSRHVAWLLAAALLTLPEFLVRGAYGGYFAASTLLAALLLALLHERARPPTSVLGGALAFLADQKGALVPLAWSIAAPRGTGRRRFVLLAGAAAGAAAFALYGLVLHAPSFVFEFIQEHALRRLDPRHLRFAMEATRGYPSVPQLWGEYAGRYGIVWLLAVAAATARGLKDPRVAVRAAATSVLLGAVVFSITDWRQTKHLAQLAAPATVLLAAICPVSVRWRSAWLAAAGVVVFRNLLVATHLVAEFDRLRPAGGW